MSDPFHNNVSVSPVHGSWEGERRTVGWLCACLPRREGALRTAPGAGKRGGAVAGRGMARPLHDDDGGGDDDELHRVPQAKITKWWRGRQRLFFSF